ncbi:MAG: GNAT family N-acetyltransferase [Syntrophobacteraceae bacterium]
MDYHADRFTDHSLMIYRGGRLAALLPANLASDGTVMSHQGLTFGGLVISPEAKLREVLKCFRAGLSYLHDRKVGKLLYKRIPQFYCMHPDDEVAYALFLLDAQLYRRDCAAVITLADRLPFKKDRKWHLKKARRAGVRVEQDSDFLPFWERVLVPRLERRHGVKPVHTVGEISLLASRFPAHIKQFSAYCGDEIVAGATIYETPTVAHTQYLGVSDEGQKIGALDFLIAWLINECYKDKRYFSFGICNQNGGRTLNHGLLYWKEGFGGRCCVHDFYEVATANYPKLEAVLQSGADAVHEPSTWNRAWPNCIQP